MVTEGINLPFQCLIKNPTFIQRLQDVLWDILLRKWEKVKETPRKIKIFEWTGEFRSIGNLAAKKDLV